MTGIFTNYICCSYSLFFIFYICICFLQEDSGGPLVINGTLIGLVSWRRRCAIPDYPSVYTNIPELRDYITEFTGI